MVEALGAGTTIDLVKVAITTPAAPSPSADNVENATLVNAVAFNPHRQCPQQHPHRQWTRQCPRRRPGADALIGGLGNDTYVIDDAGDTITDTGGSIPSVEAAPASRN